MKAPCVCGYPFAPDDADLAFTASWHRGHKRRHMETYPGLDYRSVWNLDEAIREAEERELTCTTTVS